MQYSKFIEEVSMEIFRKLIPAIRKGPLEYSDFRKVLNRVLKKYDIAEVDEKIKQKMYRDIVFPLLRVIKNSLN